MPETPDLREHLERLLDEARIPVSVPVLEAVVAHLRMGRQHLEQLQRVNAASEEYRKDLRENHQRIAELNRRVGELTQAVSDLTANVEAESANATHWRERATEHARLLGSVRSTMLAAMNSHPGPLSSELRVGLAQECDKIQARLRGDGE
jgi:methyl-accepting chemotaxis protein